MGLVLLPRLCDGRWNISGEKSNLKLTAQGHHFVVFEIADAENQGFYLTVFVTVKQLVQVGKNVFNSQKRKRAEKS